MEFQQNCQSSVETIELLIEIEDKYIVCSICDERS